jgi:hypothetical protein
VITRFEEVEGVGVKCDCVVLLEDDVGVGGCLLDGCCRLNSLPCALGVVGLRLRPRIETTFETLSMRLSAVYFVGFLIILKRQVDSVVLYLFS